jgi:hypothetical protein
MEDGRWQVETPASSSFRAQRRNSVLGEKLYDAFFIITFFIFPYTLRGCVNPRLSVKKFNLRQKFPGFHSGQCPCGFAKKHIYRLQ